MYYYFLLLIPFLYSCENEPLDKADSSKVIAVDSELYNLIQRATGNDFDNDITCIDFNYAFSLIVYDENMDVVTNQVIRSDSEFSEFLEGLEEGKSISLSYPITSVLDSGEPFVINNNEELKEAINKCLEADTVNTYNGILTQTSCIWKVNYLDGPNTEYGGSYFEVSNFGNVGLNFQNHSFGGTWITYFIENQLHLNIFITGDEEVSNDWNFDWKVISFDENQIEIDNGIDHFSLTKDCYEPCRKFLFEECETEPGTGKAVFELESYFNCFFPFTRISDSSTVSWSYFETYEDMIEGINPINNLHYENALNPQIIYVRFDNLNSGEMETFIGIVLKVINC